MNVGGGRRWTGRRAASVLLLVGLAGPGCRPAPPDFSDVPEVPLESVFPTEAPAERRVYTVRRGDTLSKIAREEGVGLGAILRANPGLDPDVIQVGQEIVLPGRGGGD